MFKINNVESFSIVYLSFKILRGSIDITTTNWESTICGCLIISISIFYYWTM